MLPITYLFGVLARYAVANTVLLAYLANSDVGLGNVDNTADSAKSVKYATSAGSASSATKATQDSSSQTITSTYIKSLSVSGRTITFTRGNNTTGSITTQDTDTTYSVGTNTYSGTTKLYTTTGSNTDGTMTQKAISAYFPTDSKVISKDEKVQIRRSDDWVTFEGILKSTNRVAVALNENGIVIHKYNSSGEHLGWTQIGTFGMHGECRHQYVKYFDGTAGNNYVTATIDENKLTDRKLPQYPCVLATLQTTVTDFYITSADRVDDRTLKIYFNKAYSGSFVIAYQFTTYDK